MDKDPFNLIITGVGGQGNVLASQIIGRTLLKNEYKVTVGETYGLSQRGGAVLSHIRVSKKMTLGPLIPMGLAHAVVALEPAEALRVLPDYGNKDVVTVVNSRPVHPMGVIAGETVYPDLDVLKEKLQELSGQLYWVDATQIAMELGDAILANVVMLGALIQTGLLDVSAESVIHEIEDNFPESKWDVNRKALVKGMAALGG
ncbi:MAG: indolepyruvate oxidoreductase subunit beta [Deltaproteobacteria bacterium]|nr:indolepyruvate oxidoreductase subunit beta [Deltaproteobacteria bacterium]